MIKYFEIQTSKGILRGFQHIPINSRGKVFIQHGYFSSNHLGPNRLYFQIADLLCSIGYDVFRYSCIGMGDSDGSIETTTYELHYNNHQNVIEKFSDDDEEIILIGHSMGTSLSVKLAAKYKPSKLILLAPSLGPIDKLSNLFSPAQLSELLTAGNTERKGLLISQKFMLESQDDTILTFCEKIKNVQIQLHFGLNDELYDIETILSISKKLNGTLYTYKNTDHNFLDMQTRNDLFNNIISSF